ncbi:MAG: hypothetical protein WBA97_32495 [Actinophytocola sp.]|uniref:hypothetical protein n=1 Tax=Actinophytocola sp. TaxID=1872138 RepID=UPI003C781E63
MAAAVVNPHQPPSRAHGTFREADAIVTTGPAELAPARAVDRREQQKPAASGSREPPGHSQGRRIIGVGCGQTGGNAEIAFRTAPGAPFITASMCFSAVT